MEHLYDYALFTAKLLTVIGVLGMLAACIALWSATRRQRYGDSQLTVHKLNDRAREGRLALEAAMLPRKQLKQHLKDIRRERKAADNAAPGPSRRRVFVCRFTGDLRATAVAALREEVSCILAVAQATDEVAVVLESAGGTIHGYGLAASQLSRIRARGIHLSVVVDRIAASGGYMMACVADTIIAAPFAIIGSIGVVAQLPNFHRLLRNNAIDFEQITAGKYKRTLSLFGENTDAGREKFQEEVDDAHALFKDFVVRYRPGLDLERVATGEYWLGLRALEFGLVDRIATSDEFLHERIAEADVFEIVAGFPKHWSRRLWERVRALTTTA